MVPEVVKREVWGVLNLSRRDTGWFSPHGGFTCSWVSGVLDCCSGPIEGLECPRCVCVYLLRAETLVVVNESLQVVADRGDASSIIIIIIYIYISVCVSVLA